MQMEDNTGHNEHDGHRRPAGSAPEAALAELMPSHTPKQRRTILKGLRILARIALRAHMERRWPGPTIPPDGEDRVEGEQTDE